MQRFRLNLHFVVDVESDLTKEAILAVASSLATAMHKATANTARITKSTAEVVKEAAGTERLAEFRPEEVLPFIGKETKHVFEVGDKKYPVTMSSQRYYTFRDSLNCAACGIEGTKFVLEKTSGASQAHLNLYAVEDGRLVLMTKDHVKPKSKGGENHHSNYQTMCLTCNGIKGCVPMPLDVIRKLRAVLRANRGLTRKSLAKLMLKQRTKLMGGVIDPKGKPNKKRMKASEPPPGVLWTTTDLNLHQFTETELWGYGVYSKVDESCEHVACVRRKTPVALVSQEGESVLVQLVGGVEFRTWLRNLSQTKASPGPEGSTSSVV
jgi:hypothetical protein